MQTPKFEIYETPMDVRMAMSKKLKSTDRTRAFYTMSIGNDSYHGFRTKMDAKKAGKLMEKFKEITKEVL